ncbi:hypothetical protein [Piscinibacter sp. XHJ-5]|uniref:hypothetical protein n=1 Tax=Piscinibacter sp. XHJ-5 TaxID=3037797 RepID=UPI00245333AA|nr:hypothetical protein [Piscinibacter sp. XHJ-5]
MKATPVLVAVALLCSFSPLAGADEAGDAPAPTGLRSEPKVQHTVIEDDGARIEELRVRGQTQRITVKPKGAIKQGYEIIPADGAREMSEGAGSSRGAAGKRVWRVFTF